MKFITIFINTNKITYLYSYLYNLFATQNVLFFACNSWVYPAALAWGWLPNINKSTVDKMVDKIEHIDTVFVSGNV